MTSPVHFPSPAMELNQPSAAAPLCAAPVSPAGTPMLATPAGACDTHAHILGPSSRHSYIAERVYTPPDCLLVQYRDMMNRLGLTRCVLVQPSVYGTDNSVMLAALAELGQGARGVAVVNPEISDAQLHDMNALGVRGLRVNLVDRRDKDDRLPLPMLRHLAERIAPLGWHLELLAHVNAYPGLDRLLGDLPVPLVFGHLGYAPAESGAKDAGLQSLLRLAEDGRAWIKMTGPYRLTRQPLPYSPVLEIAREAAARCPDRLLWGSDWPHVMLKGEMPNDARLLDLLLDWVPDETLRRKILVENPASLYGWC